MKKTIIIIKKKKKKKKTGTNDKITRCRPSKGRRCIPDVDI